jgi:hypothetical protein
MRSLIWAGWLMVAMGAALLAGSIAAGSPPFGVLMVACLAGPGLVMVCDARRRVALPGGRIPSPGERVTIKFDPHRRREVVLLEENYDVESFRTSSGLVRPPIST